MVNSTACGGKSRDFGLEEGINREGHCHGLLYHRASAEGMVKIYR
jgi:hypothetical protein